MNPSLLRVWRSWASCRRPRVNQQAIARIYCVVGLCLVHFKYTCTLVAISLYLLLVSLVSSHRIS